MTLIQGPLISCGVNHSALSQKIVTSTSTAFQNSKSNIYILTHSGKPLFSRYGVLEECVSLAGTFTALFAKSQRFNAGSSGKVGAQELQFVVTKSAKLIFLNRDPFLLVSVLENADSTGSPTDCHFYGRLLDILHWQIISILTGNIKKTLMRRPNYDVRSLLAGSDAVLINLERWMTHSPQLVIQDTESPVRRPDLSDGVSMGIEPLRLDSSLRWQFCEALQELPVPSACLLGMVLAGHKVVTMVRSRIVGDLAAKDINLIINQVVSWASLRTGTGWLPVCLPSLDENACLHAFVDFFDSDKSPLCVVFLSQSPSQDCFYELVQMSQQLQGTLGGAGLLDEVLSVCKNEGIGFALPPAEGAGHGNGLGKIDHLVFFQSSSSQLFSAPFRGSEEAWREVLRAYLKAGQMLMVDRERMALPKQVKIDYQFGFVFAWFTSSYQLFCCFPSSGEQRGGSGGGGGSVGGDLSLIDQAYSWVVDRQTQLFLPAPTPLW